MSLVTRVGVTVPLLVDQHDHKHNNSNYAKTSESDQEEKDLSDAIDQFFEKIWKHFFIPLKMELAGPELNRDLSISIGVDLSGILTRRLEVTSPFRALPLSYLPCFNFDHILLFFFFPYQLQSQLSTAFLELSRCFFLLWILPDFLKHKL